MRYADPPLFQTKVKIIEEIYRGELEEKINDFIKDKAVVSIQYMPNCNGAMIVYRVLVEED